MPPPRKGRRRVTAGVATALVAVALTALVAGCGGTSPGTLGRPAPPALGSLAGSGAGHVFYEIYDPSGPPRGTMLMLHGGGWVNNPGDARRGLSTTALYFRASGWRVVNVDYTSGRIRRPLPMMRDVVAFYDQVHRAFGGPICAYGVSAGGHLAAMLAIERPSLTCAVLQAAPLDLVSLLKDTDAGGRADITLTFGTNATALRSWSPALLWNPAIHARVFATAASNDPIVPASQLQPLTAHDPSADVGVIPGAAQDAADAVLYMHSDVTRAGAQARLSALDAWLDKVVPPRAGAAAPTLASGDVGCPASVAQRWELLQAGEEWQQSSTAGALIAATHGCSGSAQSQDDGLSLWAVDDPAAALPAGAQATLLLTTRTGVSSMSASFRGFLARPQQWVLGLYASTTTSGGTPTAVAGCDEGRCTGLRLYDADGGALIAAAHTAGDPDDSNTPPVAHFALPAGTRRIAWQLRCAAPSGCSLAGAVTGGDASLRTRDPLAEPAIFSLYGASVG